MNDVNDRRVVTEAETHQEKRRVLLFTGHMIDAPDRRTPRFPRTKEAEAVARAAIKHAVVEELRRTHSTVADGIAGGASGGDILFHEVCAELNGADLDGRKLKIETTLYLALERKAYIEASVQKAGADWAQRFSELYRRLPRRKLSAAQDPPPQFDGAHKQLSVWQRNNLWMLRDAFAADAEHGANVTLIALWDGATGDGPGGTEDMVDTARRRGARTIILDTKTLFKFG